MEINGGAHVVLRVTRFEECIRSYDRLMPELGLEAVHRSEGFVLEVNHVPGKGVFAEDATFDPAPEYPLRGCRKPAG